ncbi:MAG: endonuclease III domain-containing protein [Anaerolineae bacterium]
MAPSPRAGRPQIAPHDQEPAAAQRRRVLAVHRRLASEYPRRGDAGGLPAVDELVCTILSQNTTDRNRDRAFRALTTAYPDWDAVARAPVARVRDLIRVAGLANQKAPRIQAALRAVRTAAGGYSLDFLRKLSRDEALAWLTGLDGVGRKTASIVLLFSLDMPAFPVDTHVLRLSRRLGLVGTKISAPSAHNLLEDLVPEALYRSFHLELIDHGRGVCRARSPRCEGCVLEDLCQYPTRRGGGPG